MKAKSEALNLKTHNLRVMVENAPRLEANNAILREYADALASALDAVDAERKVSEELGMRLESLQYSYENGEDYAEFSERDPLTADVGDYQHDYEGAYARGYDAWRNDTKRDDNPEQSPLLIEAWFEGWDGGAKEEVLEILDGKESG